MFTKKPTELSHTVELNTTEARTIRLAQKYDTKVFIKLVPGFSFAPNQLVDFATIDEIPAKLEESRIGLRFHIPELTYTIVVRLPMTPSSVLRPGTKLSVNGEGRLSWRAKSRGSYLMHEADCIDFVQV